MGAVFKPFLNSGFDIAISQSDGNTEYFINKLQIWETGLAKTIALSFKNLPDRLSRLAALFSSITLRGFNTVSSDTKVNLNLQLGNLDLELFRGIVELKLNQISKKGEAN